MPDLVTGDAVTLELRVAGLPSRTLALAVDLAVQLSLLALGLVLATWVFEGGGSPGAQAAVTLAVVVGVLVGWPTLLETATRGRSLGKLLMGLRVVRDDGGPVRMRHALVRALAMVFLDLWVTSGVVGALSALVSARSKRMGDHLAGTIVVGERIPRASAPPAEAQILMPPPLAGWAAGLDLVGVPDDLALHARTFLHRAAGLDPRAREATARQLATALAGHVRTPAPVGTPAEAYLAAVLAERSRRAQLAGPAAGWGLPGPGAVAPPPSAAPATPAAPLPPAPPPDVPPAAPPPPGFTLPR
ncbi:MAG: RDD family protein [Candidatus Nanopelagicales bacterium]|nr:RDD family protein [Candidatus Nanopelagicales bacterium]